jgi:hypothetical protein
MDSPQKKIKKTRLCVLFHIVFEFIHNLRHLSLQFGNVKGKFVLVLN